MPCTAHQGRLKRHSPVHACARALLSMQPVRALAWAPCAAPSLSPFSREVGSSATRLCTLAPVPCTRCSRHGCSRLHLFSPSTREVGSSATRLCTLALVPCTRCSRYWCSRLHLFPPFIREAGSSATRLYTLALAHCMHCSVRVFLRWCLAPRWGGRLERHSLAPSSPLFCPHGRARSQGPMVYRAPAQG